MKALVSPAKSLELDKEIPTSQHTLPKFLNEAKQLSTSLSKLSKQEIADLMHISDKLADLNYSRYQSYEAEHSPANARQAIFTFNGDVYDGIDAYSIDKSNYERLQNSLRILSGLYGVLKPFDLMQAYRLEMGTKFEINKSKNLYAFWDNKITQALNQEIEADELVVNLASNEYFKAIQPNQLSGQLVSPMFKDYKNGKLKIISFYAKKARGLMYRFLLEHNVTKYEQLLQFDYDGYVYSESETKDASSPVFIR